MTRFSSLISRRPGRVIAAAVLLILVCAALSTQLGLETDLVALLPEGTAEATEYRRFLELFGGFEKVFVVLIPSARGGGVADIDSGDLLEAAESLGERLVESAEVSAVRSGLEEEDEDFFKRFVVRRSLLLLGDGALTDLDEKLSVPNLERRAAELRSLLRTPTGSLQSAFAVHDPLGFAAGLPILQSGGELPIDPVTGAFRAREGEAALLILTPSGGELDPESGRRLLADLEMAFDEVEAAFAGIECRAIGGPLYAAQDEMAIRGDMEKTITGSVIGCTLILLLAFSGLWIPTASVLVLAGSFALAGAALTLGVGQLTAVAFGFAAVLVGLGMDYAIHGATRFRQARFAGSSPSGALAQAFEEAGPGILTSALTTAAAFATLGVAHFRPLRELGLVVASGILAILFMTLFLGSALLVSRPNLSAPGPLWRGLDAGASALVEMATRWPRTVLSLAGIASLGALYSVSGLRLDADISAMRPANHPVFETERLLVERFGLGIDTATIVVEGRNLDEVLGRAAAVEQILARRVEGVSVLSAADWLLPSPAAEKRLADLRHAGLGDAVATLEAALRSNNLAPRAFSSGLEALTMLGQGQDPGAPRRDDWPGALSELLRETPSGIAAALRLRLPDGTWAGGPPAELLEEIRGVAPGASVASAPRLGAAMKRLANQDMRRLSWLGILLVTLVVGFSFRGDARAGLLAIVPVTLGTLWTLGFWAALGRPLDLLSLSVVPILLGIGIDDGLHAVHGTGERPGDKMARRVFLPARLAPSVKASGLAMSLTTLTTCVGFGSLAFSSIPGLARGGLLVPIGVMACLLATLMVLPALGTYGKKSF